MSRDKNSKKQFKKWRPKADDGEKVVVAKNKVTEPFVPTLAQRTKWSQWKDALADEAKYEFGVLGHMCDIHAYPEPAKIEIKS